MKRRNVRLTSAWVALAAVATALLMHRPPPDAPVAAYPVLGRDSGNAAAGPRPVELPGPRTPSRLAPLLAPRFTPWVATPRPPVSLRRAPSPTRPRAPTRPSLSLLAHVGDTIPVEFTAYCLRTLTRLDHTPREGIVAADPRVFPLGREIELILGGRSLGRFQVDDTGLLIKGRIVDIWLPDCRSARRFGRQRGTAILLEKAPKPAR